MNDLKIKPIQRLKKICIHWTAGAYGQTDDDFRHYHYTVGKDGVVLRGKFEPATNIPPLPNGKYAAHCGGGNSYCIGVALRGMAGYQRPGKVGAYPLTQKQCESAWAWIARLCIEHRIQVTPETVFTHYEFGKLNPDSDSAGKIDITHLPHQPNLKPGEIGDYIRQKVCWYIKDYGGTP